MKCSKVSVTHLETLTILVLIIIVHGATEGEATATITKEERHFSLTNSITIY